MKRARTFGWLMLVCGGSLAFSACGGDDDEAASGNAAGAHSSAGAGHGGEAPGQAGSAAADGSDECKVMGELCHEADMGSGAAHDCHELGHEGDGAACVSKFAECINTCVPEAPAKLSLQDARCAALGELCHPVDDKTGALHACHELGHQNDASACAAQFADCAAGCLAARHLLETSGAAGAGGAATAAGGTAGSAG